MYVDLRREGRAKEIYLHKTDLDGPSQNWDNTHGAIKQPTGREAAVLDWVGKERLAGVSKGGVQDKMGVAQFSGKHPNAKRWKGEGSGVLEIVEDHRGDTYRAVYTVKFANAA